MRLLLPLVLLALVSCDGEKENAAERNARTGFPGWKCPLGSYITQGNPRYQHGVQDLPTDQPVCIPYSPAEWWTGAGMPNSSGIDRP